MKYLFYFRATFNAFHFPLPTLSVFHNFFLQTAILICTKNLTISNSYESYMLCSFALISVHFNISHGFPTACHSFSFHWIMCVHISFNIIDSVSFTSTLFLFSLWFLLPVLHYINFYNFTWWTLLITITNDFHLSLWMLSFLLGIFHLL